MSEKNCMNCRYTPNWPKNRAGRRIHDSVAECEYPTPPLPDSVKKGLNAKRLIWKAPVDKSNGKTCVFFESRHHKKK